jgi:serine/threonine protein kinase
MAPEQEKEGIVTVRSDIYSLGMTVLQVFFGKDLRPAYLSAPDGLDELRSLLRSMLEVSPARRPVNTAVVAERLSAASEAAGVR